MTSDKKAVNTLDGSKSFLYLGIFAYLIISLLLFFTWVNPSLLGENNHHIAADSGTYMSFAKSLKDGENDPFVMASLYSFPNTLWGPVLLGLALNSTVSIMVFNYVVLIFCLWLITQAADVSLPLFLVLLFANVTTSISLLTLNKEITDLLVTSLFVYYLGRGKRVALLAAILISAICRYETCIVISLYLILESRWNIFRYSRRMMLIFISVSLSIFLSTVLAGAMQYRLQEATATASSGGLLLMLDTLQIHYLFVVAVIPKVLDSLFAELINISHWGVYSIDDPANGFFLFGNNVSNFGLIVYLLMKRRFTLRSNLVYYACLSAIFMSTAMIIQPRYFYGAYVVLCIEGARHRPARKPLRPFGEVCAIA